MPSSLLAGARSNLQHVGTRFLNMGRSLHPLQRAGLAPVGIGTFPATDTVTHGSFGNAPAAAPTSLGTPPNVTFAVNQRGSHV